MEGKEKKYSILCGNPVLGEGPRRKYRDGSKRVLFDIYSFWKNSGFAFLFFPGNNK